MKKIGFILLVIALALPGFAQTAHYKFNTDHYETIIQGLGEESLSFAHTGAIKLNTIEVATGKKLHYAETGNPAGTPVIFLHGITDSWHSFEKVLPLLPETIHAFAITQRGHGASDKTFAGYHPKDFARDVAAFIKKQGLKKAIVAGHSLGGVVAQQFVLDYPELLQAMVLIDSDAAFKDNSVMLEFHQQVLALGDTIDEPFMDEFQKGTLAKPIDPAYYNTVVAEGLKTPAHVFKAAYTGMMDVDFTGRLKQVQHPVLLFWGEKDSFCSRADQERMLQQLPNASYLCMKIPAMPCIGRSRSALQTI